MRSKLSPQRFTAIRRVFLITLGYNWGLAALKLYLGFKVQSLSTIGDGFHSLLDGGANILALIGITIAARPPDKNHPYGHQKFEALTTLLLAGLLILTSWEILKIAIQRLFNPIQLPLFSWTTVAFLAINIFINLIVASYEKKRGLQLQSELLIADSIQSRADVYSSIIAILSLVCAKYRWFFVDAIAALGIVFLILYAAWKILKDTIWSLSDATQLDPEEIRRCVLKVKGVCGVHRIRTHGMPTDIHLDFHLELKEDITSREAFEIEDRVTEALKKQFPNLTYIGVRHQPPRTPSN